MRFRSLLPLAVLVAAACGSQLNAGITDGDYAGVNSAGQEVQVSVSGSGATVDGVRTDVDQTAQDLTFDVADSIHEHWVCKPMDQGISCRVTQSRRRPQVIQLAQI